uniref:PAP-associated domain-containing protein n=1 Tax=Angiostrongylus cantonensis TaxID=6313 RepID=A0A158P9T6_ANGCA
MIRRVDLSAMDGSNVVEKCKQYGDKYLVEPNVEAIKRWRSSYQSLFANRKSAEKLRRLSDEVLLHFEANRQTNVDSEIKMALMDEVRKVIQKRAVSAIAAYNILSNVRHFLGTDPIYEEIDEVRCVEAEVPVLKIVFMKGPNINLSCCTGSYAPGIQKSYLIRGFVLWDSRFAPLYMLVKEWATCSGVENSSNGEKYARNVNGEIRYPMVLDFNDEEFLADSPAIEKNSLSVAQLFVLFLDYYCNFSFDRYYICMREAAVRRRVRSADGDGAIDDRGNSVFIRDPIDDQNPGRSVRDVTILQDKMRRTLHFIISIDHHFPKLSEILLEGLGARERPSEGFVAENTPPSDPHRGEDLDSPLQDCVRTPGRTKLHDQQ